MIAGLLATAPRRAYVYPVEAFQVIDGDTVVCRIRAEVDFGFRFQASTSLTVRFRLEGVDTPERESKTRHMGELAAMALETLLASASAVEVESLGEPYKYGGVWMARVRVGGQDAARWMISQGYARAYDGKRAREPWDPTMRYPIAAEEG